MMRGAVCGLALLVCAPGDAASGAKDRYADGTIDVKLVEVKGYESPRAVVKAMIDAPPEKVWRIIGDCAGYSRTMERVSSSKLLERKGDTHVCQIEVDMPFPLGNLVAVTSAKHKAGPDEWYRKWKLVSGDYTVNTGSWVLTPYDEAGTKTMVHYQILAEPTTPIPDWLRNKAQKSSLPGMIERLRDEVAALK